MTRGGPRKGAGRPKHCSDVVRDRVVRICLTDSELAVLEILGEQWDVPTATAAYGLLATCIADCRKATPLALPEKLIWAASCVIAKHQPELQENAS